MSAEELWTFLREGARTAVLATVRADGRPHAAPVWFALDGGQLLFTTWHATVKAANLRRDPRVCLLVNDERPPFAYVQVEGTAALSEEPAELRRWAGLIAGRYMGAAQAEAYGARNGVPGELLVRVTPTRVVAHAEVAV
jgi:PPOX class probable F420-dependent enzyme